ncbi:unnamed protein product [Darwinula stevensoni]|uniref:Uncharacterized protein n=1 Tax=Darwinula stevensoni TaxID=69355 RepID=A0A7R9A878_9CRUS|nr:unnamed protein product [Darwinula stevensoni]CAG0896131.1 unnamed protein product [Darwinula stevensoni]
MHYRVNNCHVEDLTSTPSDESLSKKGPVEEVAEKKCNTSVWLTVSFTVERYLALKKPLKGKVWFTESRAKRVIALVYILCFLSILSTPFEWRVQESQLVLGKRCLCDKLDKVVSTAKCDREVGFDIREDIQVHMGGGEKLLFWEATEKYLQKFYPEAGKTHYSLPSGLLLKDDEFKDLLGYAEKLRKEEEDLEIVKHAPDYAAKAIIFSLVKEICGFAPSLVVADYKFCETFNLGRNCRPVEDFHELQVSLDLGCQTAVSQFCPVRQVHNNS